MKIIGSYEEVEVSLTLNGEPVRARCTPRMHLADFLRHKLYKAGTHVGCEHGVCGACTVLIDGEATRSCLVYAVQVSGAAVETVEGLAAGSELSPLQKSFRDNFAIQCGFCTPGILMSAVDLMQNVPNPMEREIRDLLGGHLCRCTGYESIVQAIKAAAAQAAADRTAKSTSMPAIPGPR